MPETPQQPAAAKTPEPQPAPTYQAPQSLFQDEEIICQLELRAIFGVDHEMTSDEIIHRSAKLPGIKNLTRLSPGEANALNSLHAITDRLGFGKGGLKIIAGNSPIDFICNGKCVLAVQAEGGYSPGVKETLMIVAREFAKM